MEQGGVLARLGDIYSPIGNKALAKAVWRRAPAILEELRGLGAEEVRSRLGAMPGARGAQRLLILYRPRDHESGTAGNNSLGVHRWSGTGGALRSPRQG